MKKNWNDIWEWCQDAVMKALCAIIWLGILCIFSYYNLLKLCFLDTGIGLSMAIIEQMGEYQMIFSNIGLIGMVYVDNTIASMLNHRHHDTAIQKVIFIIVIILALLMTIIGREVAFGSYQLRCQAIPTVMFFFYLVLLLFYKMKSLEVEHINAKEF